MCTTVHKWKSEVTLQKLSLSLHHVGHRYWIQVIRLVGNALLSLATSPALTHPFLWTKLMWCPSEPEHRSTSSVSHFNRKPHLSHCSSGWVAPLDQTAPASCRTLGGGGDLPVNGLFMKEAARVKTSLFHVFLALPLLQERGLVTMLARFQQHSHLSTVTEFHRQTTLQ